jgi:tetratricopeptide (TPR) repeat protein
MKNLIYILTLTLFFSGFSEVTAQELTQYEKLLKKNVILLDSIKDKDSCEDVLFRFERLQKVAPDKWEAAYYSAYCKILLTRWRLDKENLANEAASQLEETIKIANNSEVMTLLARAYMKKIELQKSNGPKYTGKVKALLKDAVKKDPNNPRAYMMYGTFYYFFPGFVGGDKVKAIQLFEKAVPIFASEEAKNKENYTYLPHWGKSLNLWYLKTYKK